MLDALLTNTAWWLKALDHSTQWCVFHRATYKDVSMALNVNRLIVSAPPCITSHHNWQQDIFTSTKLPSTHNSHNPIHYIQVLFSMCLLSMLFYILIHGGTQKFPELLKKIYLKYLYKFETLVPFEVLPLRLDAAIPVLSRASSNLLEALDSISVEDFRLCFQHWEWCWDCCIQ